jgi:hypothetical protein
MREMKDLPIASTWQAKTIAAVQLDRQTQQKGASLVRYFISVSAKESAPVFLELTPTH